MRIPTRQLAWAAATAVLVAAMVTAWWWSQQPSRDTEQALAQAQFRELAWDDLAPKDWDPVKRFLELNHGQMDDSDAQGTRLMRAIWDQAPTVASLNDTAVRLPGYVVPLDDSPKGLTEFLLVPYFGACIHTPPPPANQIVHVVTREPVTGFRAMDTVWVSGRLTTQRDDSPMGSSGYQLDARVVEAYARHKPTRAASGGTAAAPTAPASAPGTAASAPSSSKGSMP